MKIIFLLTLFSFSALANNNMVCEKVTDPSALSSFPTLIRCENQKEVCFFSFSGSNPTLSCIPKSK